MSKWFLSTKRADFDKIGEKYSINPVIARVIRNREIIEEKDIEKYLYGSLENLYNPELLLGIKEAVVIIKKKIEGKNKIRIIGDYDVDGICSSYILKRGLVLCGASVDTVIPHRIKDGYGINDQLIEEAHEDGIDTIITCDNGIAASSQIAYAKSLGITCIVTDHHEIPYEENNGEKIYILPPADVIIDPKLMDCPYPFKKICGAVVAWKLMTALFKEYNIKEEDKRELLELAGFATICDVMELLDENRIIVKEAIKSMKNSANVGLRALMKVHEINPEILASYHIGFVLGPCFNATGRLDTATRAIELLECKCEREAICIASELKEMNESRKVLTEQGVEDAIQILNSTGISNDKVIVIYLPDCHESLAGIIAGRIRERYCRPTFVLTKAEEGVKGSGRSIDAYSMYEEMSKCKELFSKYGGHKLAAGLSLPEENVDIFRKRINALCSLGEDDFYEKVTIDVPMPLSYVTEGLIKELELLEPFGMGNHKPVFAQKNLSFISLRVMGKNKDMGKFIVEDEAQNRFTLLLFRNLHHFLEDVEKKYGKEENGKLVAGNRCKNVLMNIIYYPSINTYNGKNEIQYIIQDWK